MILITKIFCTVLLGLAVIAGLLPMLRNGQTVSQRVTALIMNILHSVSIYMLWMYL